MRACGMWSARACESRAKTVGHVHRKTHLVARNQEHEYIACMKRCQQNVHAGGYTADNVPRSALSVNFASLSDSLSFASNRLLNRSWFSFCFPNVRRSCTISSRYLYVPMGSARPCIRKEDMTDTHRAQARHMQSRSSASSQFPGAGPTAGR